MLFKFAMKFLCVYITKTTKEAFPPKVIIVSGDKVKFKNKQTTESFDFLPPICFCQFFAPVTTHTIVSTKQEMQHYTEFAGADQATACGLY